MSWSFSKSLIKPFNEWSNSNQLLCPSPQSGRIEASTTQTHGIISVGKDLRDHQVQPWSNHCQVTTKPCSQVPHPHIGWIVPGMVIPPSPSEPGHPFSEYFLVLNQTYLPGAFRPLPLSMLLVTWEQRPTPAWLQPPLKSPRCLSSLHYEIITQKYDLPWTSCQGAQHQMHRLILGAFCWECGSTLCAPIHHDGARGKYLGRILQIHTYIPQMQKAQILVSSLRISKKGKGVAFTCHSNCFVSRE